MKSVALLALALLVPFLALVMAFAVPFLGLSSLLIMAALLLALGLVTDLSMSRRDPNLAELQTDRSLLDADTVTREENARPLFRGRNVRLSRGKSPLLRAIGLDVLGTAFGLILLIVPFYLLLNH